MGLEKITYYRNKRNMTIEELSAKSNVPIGTLSKISAGITKDPKLETVRAIAKALNCTLDDFLEEETNSKNFFASLNEQDLINKYRILDNYGKEMIDCVLDKELYRIQQEAENTNKVIQLNSVLTYDLPASAGTGMFLDSESCEHIDYPADEVPQGTDFAVRISGDSMSPGYADGSIAFVRKEQVKQGEIGVFVLNGESYIKQLDKKGGKLCLVSLNPAYKPIKILDTDSLYCVGKVLN